MEVVSKIRRFSKMDAMDRLVCNSLGVSRRPYF